MQLVWRQCVIGDKIASTFLISTLVIGLSGIAFADSGENNQQSSSQDHTEHQLQDNNTQFNQESNQTQSEYNQNSTNENNQNVTEGENQTQANQQGVDEINNENNNEKATHQENQQDANNVENAIENKTVAAEVNIGVGNQETKSIDSNIEVHTDNSIGDTVSVTVGSKTESGPKVIIFNLNSTTIDAANVKYLHITYDGHSIAPATDVNAVLHPKNTDEPSYAIIVTQNGAQILVSIPHFSTHTITISKISKVISPVPEFPFAILALMIGIFSIILIPKIRLSIN